MPIYEYRCSSCGQRVEVLVRNSGDASALCPECGAELSERLPTAPALVGTGDRNSGVTCCGREERCERPPCSEGGHCCHS